MGEPTPNLRWPVPLLDDLVDAADLQELAEAINDDIASVLAGAQLAASMPGATVGVNSQAVAALAWTTISFREQAVWDTDAMYDPGTPDRLHMRRAGLVSVTARPSQSAPTASKWVQGRVLRGGQEVLRRKAHPVPAGGSGFLNLAVMQGMVYVRPGEHLSLQIQCDVAITVSQPTLMAQYVVYDGPHRNANPHFETAISPWTGSGVTVLDRVGTPRKAGLFAARFTPDGTAGTAYMQSEKMPAAEEQTYSATGYVNPSAALEQAQLALAFFDGSGTLISAISGPVSAAAANAWRFLHATAAAPAGTASVAIRAQAPGTPPASTDVRWDELYLDQLYPVAP